MTEFFTNLELMRTLAGMFLAFTIVLAIIGIPAAFMGLGNAMVPPTPPPLHHVQYVFHGVALDGSPREHTYELWHRDDFVGSKAVHAQVWAFQGNLAERETDTAWLDCVVTGLGAALIVHLTTKETHTMRTTDKQPIPVYVFMTVREWDLKSLGLAKNETRKVLISKLDPLNGYEPSDIVALAKELVDTYDLANVTWTTEGTTYFYSKDHGLCERSVSAPPYVF